MIEFCIHEKHGGICEKTGTYCNLGACPYEDLKEFTVVQHGQWIYKYHTWSCNICGCHPYKGYIPKEPSNFCPNCGARMDGKAMQNER